MCIVTCRITPETSSSPRYMGSRKTTVKYLQLSVVQQNCDWNLSTNKHGRVVDEKLVPSTWLQKPGNSRMLENILLAQDNPQWYHHALPGDHDRPPLWSQLSSSFPSFQIPPSVTRHSNRGFILEIPRSPSVLPIIVLR